MTYFRFLVLVCLLAGRESTCLADEPGVRHEAVSLAIRKAIPLLEKAAAGSAKERTCFTCHSQAMPVFALAEARKHGFAIDEEVFATQLEHTAVHLKRGLNGYRNGKGQGGRVLTAGYALWTLEVGDWKSDETTEAVVHYLLEFQKSEKRWHHKSSRPPSAGSDFTNTYLALRALSEFATDDQQQAVDERIKGVGKWLLATDANETEDLVFRFRSLPYVSASSDQLNSARDALVSRQQIDGGWSQKSGMSSDAYATGSVLAALLWHGVIPSDDAVERGLKYLLDAQLEDGSWHVATRAKPIQTYFETGFPHGEDQFISTSATAWSTIALTLTLPTKESETDR